MTAEQHPKLASTAATSSISKITLKHDRRFMGFVGTLGVRSEPLNDRLEFVNLFGLPRNLD